MSLIRRTDWFKRTAPLPLQDQKIIRKQYPDLRYEDLMGAIHVETVDKRMLVGFFAVRYLTRFLPLLWLLVPLLYLPGMNWLGPRVYRWVARRRYAINRWFGGPACENDTCRIH